MARKTLEDALEQLEKVFADPSSADSLAQLRLVLAAVSRLTRRQGRRDLRRHEIAELATDLVAAFERLSVDP